VSFYDKEYSLVVSTYGRHIEENSTLWSYEEILLTELDNESPEVRKGCLKAAYKQCRISPGLYHQSPKYAVSEPVHAHDKYMSPDQLIALTGSSYKYNWGHHEDIWEEIKRQKFRYDNVNPGKPERWIRPWDLIFYGYCAGSFICKLLVMLTALACVVSCLRKQSETSGKLLAFTKCQTLKDKSFVMKMTWYVCSLLVKIRNGGWDKVFGIYFPDIRHPNTVKAKKVFA
jgi:hypothetical protein